MLIERLDRCRKASLIGEFESSGYGRGKVGAVGEFGVDVDRPVDYSGQVGADAIGGDKDGLVDCLVEIDQFRRWIAGETRVENRAASADRRSGLAPCHRVVTT